MTPFRCCVYLRLEGPMQSWGNHARGPNRAHRTTHTRPTKSGVVGMVANALGRDFTDRIDDLAAMSFGVRADMPGRLEVDYHTAGAGGFPLLPGNAYRNPKWFSRLRRDDMTLHDDQYAAPADVTWDVATSTLVSGSGKVVVTHDWYLSDASFLASLAGPRALVEEIAESLTHPRRPIYLGRRAYLPSRSVLVGTGDVLEPVEALAIPPRTPRGRRGPLQAWIEPSPPVQGSVGEALVVSDQPLSYGGPTARAARLELAVTVNPPEASGHPVTGVDHDDLTSR
ncbi:type I-E CRISPR-associated protein Cas5/CasD [Mycobacterium hodleri]|uniref:type I-E CRISPR-associated protein Cas5/CasD n=1 Tax=Mycolicibacterium hodleri TaxID=49897 RepID=UPI0021F292A0|nr:type I-E CRISPR-associated protein Cas5/CasD [Mycolicibacterium hodleri]MCV7133201.1 type I-E CRISPR-associated protein Cas5/CasD [Mycolicibacterium hodleri]